MILESSKSIRELIQDISLAKGTTVEAIKVLNEKSFDVTVKEAFNAAVKRSAEITAESEDR